MKRHIDFKMNSAQKGNEIGGNGLLFWYYATPTRNFKSRNLHIIGEMSIRNNRVNAVRSLHVCSLMMITH